MPESAANSTISSETGVTVARRWTTPGVHPFDEVEWELRDAVIGDPANPAFEQRGVEFPKSWSQNATNIVAQKYFRGRIGSPERESSVKQMIGRVAGTIAGWGREGGYFASDDDADAFEAELTHILLHQKAAFNSPVWFNVGFEERPQCSACFILSVEDTMESILDWNTKEGMIFRGGSGSGINLSNIRGSVEHLSKGGFASGPVSFMRGADAWAGTIKSGGKTRRAAKMVVLDVDHPDIEDFIWCKAREEEKAAALRDAGFDMSIDGEGFTSIQYQNANNSVRVTKEFMDAVEADADWDLVARVDGRPTKTLPARELMNQIAEAAWRCADPGVQYDTEINRWHTCPESGRINASNPCCFVGETFVQTLEGPVAFEDLYDRFEAGETLPYTWAFGGTTPSAGRISRVWVAGKAQRLVEIETDAGETLRCTPEHRFLLADGTYVDAQALRQGARLQAICPALVPAGAPGYDMKTPPVDPLSDQQTVADVREIALEEPVPVFDLEVPGFHNFVVTASEHVQEVGLVVHNSEYMHVDDSACNLASLNLMRFRREDGSFDTAEFEHVVDIVFLAQEIVVSPSSYPTEEIGRNARAFRQLGLGYANLGALLMSNGLPYDSDEGRNVAAAITALMTGRGYRKSAEIAAAVGPYEEYAKNRATHNNVMRMHRDASYEIDATGTEGELLDAARRSWDEAVELGERHGYRNAQATVLAPTGTISFLMDCDTTGIEPDFSLVKFKELVGGGQMTIVNRTVPMALRTLGYSEPQIEQIEAHINERGTIVGAPSLAEEHLPIFDVAVGERAISHMGHIKMMAAAQPFLSGAISKCVAGDSLVTTVDGLVRIGSLHQGERPDSFRSMALELASLDGMRETDAFYYGGLKETIEVELRSGHRVVGTPNHRVLVAREDGEPHWKRLDELEDGDFVGLQYGDDLWAELAPTLTEFVPPKLYGSQQRITLPERMSGELAFFLGAFAAEGHVTRSNYTVRIANADEEVIDRLVATIRLVFGIEPRVTRDAERCPSVDVSSKTLVEFLDYLGCGDRASNKRIPDAVLRSPRQMVLDFLAGLSLDSYLPSSLPKWAICLDSKGLLDDLQAVLTNLGIVHSRITKWNATYEKAFDEVYAHGRHAAKLAAMLPFAERHKRFRAAELAAAEFGPSQSDLIPGVAGRKLYSLLPKGRSGRSGKGSGHSREFGHLLDPRTHRVSRDSLERVATVPGVQLEDWMRTVLERNLHFSPVSGLREGGVREVYDVSVPESHAFVGNGLVNHNTVNLPQSATVEDIADAYKQGHELGLKALAIYRDGSKTAQALRTDAQEEKEAEAEVSTAAIEPAPARRKMPRERESITHKFSIAGHEGYITAGKYEDGKLGEIFLTDIGKEGSTLRGMMNAFATAISLGLQYGVPLEVFVKKFSYMRFDPEGITTNPEIPFAKSMPDYIMRWLASRFVEDLDELEDLGILTPEVRARKEAQLAMFSEDTAAPANGGGSGNGHANGGGSTEPRAAGASKETIHQPGKTVAAAEAMTDTPPVVPAQMRGGDLGPACEQCGGMMQRTGSCYTCSSCGNNTGCG